MSGEIYGTIGLTTQDALSGAYDDLAAHTVLYPEFYAWVLAAARSAAVPADADVLDIGCGSGRLLREFIDGGYSRVSGVDFSDGCVALSRQQLPDVPIRRHNILDGSVGPAKLVLMTEVMEHVADPRLALHHVRQSMAPGGWLILTFPNRLAYWPGYYLAPLRHRLPGNQRLQHWFTWFTMPYEMRSTQPIDHAYATGDVRAFLHEAGFTIQVESGLRLFPMLRITGLSWTERFISMLERRAGRFVPRALFYRYMFVCRVAT